MTTRGSDQMELSRSQAVTLEALRAGVAGNARAAERLARRIVRDGVDEPDDRPLRMAISRMLVDHAGAPPRTRRRAVSSAPVPTPVDAESRLPLARVDDFPSDERPILGEKAAKQVALVIEERRLAADFAAAGVEPTKSVLFVGPPGTGKTMTAAFLAASLGMPLVRVELAALMSSFLGRTGQNLHQLLDYGRSGTCVVLLDEFDALAKRRDDATDVGELKRIVNVLLLELERWPSTSLLVAATNHPHLLDPAIERRFDAVIEFELPSVLARLEMLARLLSTDPDSEAEHGLAVAAAVATDGMSGAQLERLVNQAARQAIVGGNSTADEVAALALERLRDTSSDRSSRIAFALLAHTRFGMSRREIAKLLGTTHPTVAKMLVEAGEMLSEVPHT